MKRLSCIRSSRPVPKPRATIPVLLLAAALSLIAGCASSDKQQAKALVEAGSKTSDQLAEYYITLARDMKDWLIFYSLDQARTGTEINDRTRQDFQKAEGALLARAAMAKKLKAVYDASGELINYDASGETQKAVDDLKGAIEDASQKKFKLPISGVSAADSTKFLDKATQVIVGWVQMRDFRKSASKAEAVLQDVRAFFNSEKGLYVNFAEEYDKQTEATARYLIQNGLATGTQPFRSIQALYGFETQSSLVCDSTMSAQECKEMGENRRILKKWSLELLDQKKADLDEAARKDADALSMGLANVVQRHNDFMHHRKTVQPDGTTTSK